MSSHEGVRVDLAEDALAYSFHDHELGVGALSTWRDGFSRLEFLGDSILGLAVFATAEAAGWVRELAMDRVDNEHLDRLFDQRLRRCTTSHTGDVIEALIAAIHLDGGFEEAARVGVALCLPELAPYSPAALREAVPDIGHHGFAFVGAAVFKAVAADVLCRAQPERNHEWYSETRSRLTSRHHLAAVAMERGYAKPGDVEVEAVRTKAANRLERVVGKRFLLNGWTAAHLTAADLLGLRVLDAT